ncbi:MAG: hypothetical protein VKK62_10425 [Synechococcaceae cyanobacterium]|nr:hypothetical protein [Synechococcaceae cyanobacterium]
MSDSPSPTAGREPRSHGPAAGSWPALLLLALISLGAAAFVLSLAALQFPELHADGDLFVPITLNLGGGKGWIVSGYTPFVERYDNTLKYDYHAFAYPLILGSLLRSSTPERLYGACGLINALAIVLVSGLAFFSSSRRSTAEALQAGLLGICAGMVGLALQGRPEQLALLVIPWTWWCRRLFRSTRALVIVGALAIPALSAISPLLGLYFWVAWSVVLRGCNGLSLRDFLRLQALTLAAAVLLFALAIQALTPYDLPTLLRRMTTYGRTPFIQGYQLLQIGSLRLQVPLWPLPLLLTLLAGALALLRRRQWLLLLLLAAPLLLLARLSGSYLYLPFLPTSLLILRDRCSLLPGHWSRLGRVLLLAFLSLYALALLRTLLLAGLYQAGDARFSEVRQRLAIVRAEARRRGGVVAYGTARTPTLTVFADPGDELIAIRAKPDPDELRALHERRRGSRIEAIVLAQQGHSPERPPGSLDAGRFRLVFNGWSDQRARLAGLRLGGYRPGYRVAIYRRLPDGAPDGPAARAASGAAAASLSP